MQVLIGIGIFLFIVLLGEGSYFAYRTFHSSEKKEIRRRLSALPSMGHAEDAVDITRKRVLSEVAWFNRALLKFRLPERTELLMEQAGTQHTLGSFILLSGLLALAGFQIGLWISSNYMVSLAGIVFLGILPVFYLVSKKRKRMEKFQRQLPEALDLVARALRAGHAFSTALKMVADEMDNPIGVEFDKTLNEINFGVGVPEALKNLARRIDSLDLKFFVICVVIQRETGGNLAEILESIARIIRERYKLHGRIRILATEGKLSAIILASLPFFVALFLSIVNPGYIGVLLKDPFGNVLAGFGLFLMIIGILSMRKMIAIKV